MTTSPATAATFAVNKTADTNDGACDFDDCSLREAIADANATPASDKIVLPKGYYRLDLDIGSLVITEPLTITGGGALSTEVVGQEFGGSGFGKRIFDINGAQDVELSGFTIRGGEAVSGEDGGGVRSTGTDHLELHGMRMDDNIAEGFGGAISSFGTLTVTSSTFSGNSAGISGGAISNSGTVTIASSTISGNEADALGGGIVNSLTLTLISSNLSANRANNGGGIYNAGGLTLKSSTLSENLAVSGGGGIYNSDFGTLTAINSTLSRNFAGTAHGGSIYNAGTATITSSTLSTNSSSATGGAINNTGTGTVRVNSSTITSNATGTAVGGIRVWSGSVTLTSSIVIGNRSPSGDPDCSAGVNSDGYNVVGEGTGCPVTGTDVTSPDSSFLGASAATEDRQRRTRSRRAASPWAAREATRIATDRPRTSAASCV